MRHWLRLLLRIPKGLSDPLSNFLMEQGATGVEEIEEEGAMESLKAFFLWERGQEGALRSLKRYLRSLHKMDPSIPSIPVETAIVPDQMWGESWRRFFKPFRVGSRFVVKPPWARIRLRKDELPIEIDPGMAFGTGTHATTQLCLRALEKRLKRKGLRVLDVGTGSGILAIAAARLGAGEVLGIDVDQMALENAKENVIRNGVTDRVRIRKGKIGKVSGRFDLVVANLDFKSLRKMKGTLIHHLRSNGLLILSGLQETEEEKIRQQYSGDGSLKWVETDRQEGWICLTFHMKGS